MKKTKISKKDTEQTNGTYVSILMNSGLRRSEICNKESIFLSCHNADIKLGSNSFRHHYTSNHFQHIANNIGHVSINMTAKYINNDLT